MTWRRWAWDGSEIGSRGAYRARRVAAGSNGVAVVLSQESRENVDVAHVPPAIKELPGRNNEYFRLLHRQAERKKRTRQVPLQKSNQFTTDVELSNCKARAVPRELAVVWTFKIAKGPMHRMDVFCTHFHATQTGTRHYRGEWFEISPGFTATAILKSSKSRKPNVANEREDEFCVGGARA